jgi:pimeloyl-ACP methyl ester carboxylesterase
VDRPREDVIELMDHLKIQRAHIHGYSMGGGIVGTLLGMIPDRFITAGFGGSGMNETNPRIAPRPKRWTMRCRRRRAPTRKAWSVSVRAWPPRDPRAARRPPRRGATASRQSI